MALVPYEGQDDDADALILDNYEHGFSNSNSAIYDAVSRQEAMILWARENVVDDVVVYRGFQILEAASNYADQEIQRYALQVLREAQNSSSAMIQQTAEEVVATFDVFKSNLFSELQNFSEYVETKHNELRGELQGTTKRLEAHSIAQSERAKIEATTTAISLAAEAESRAVESATRSTNAATLQIESVRKTLSKQLQESKALLEEIDSRTIITTENVEEANRRIKRIEEAIAEAKRQTRNFASGKNLAETNAQIEELRALIRPISSFVQDHSNLLDDVGKQREGLKAAMADITALRKRSDDLERALEAATKRNASKEEVRNAIAAAAAAQRQQRSSNAPAAGATSPLIQETLRQEIAAVVGQLESACAVLEVLHFPEHKFDDLSLSERIMKMSQLAVAKAAQPKFFKPLRPAESPPPLRPAVPRQFIDLTSEQDTPPKRPEFELVMKSPIPARRPVDDVAQEQDFIARLRRASKARKDSIESDSESLSSAATDVDDSESMARSIGLAARKELTMHNSHMTLLTFPKIPKEEFLARWRDRIRKHVRTAKDQADMESMLAKMGSSHMMLAAASKSKDVSAIYSAIKSHELILAEIMRFELRALGATGYIIDSVERSIRRSSNQKRKKPFDYEDLLDKLSRTTQPRLGHQSNFSRGRGNRRFRGGYQPTLNGLQPFQPYQQPQPQQQFQQPQFRQRRGGFQQ